MAGSWLEPMDSPRSSVCDFDHQKGSVRTSIGSDDEKLFGKVRHLEENESTWLPRQHLDGCETTTWTSETSIDDDEESRALTESLVSSSAEGWGMGCRPDTLIPCYSHIGRRRGSNSPEKFDSLFLHPSNFTPLSTARAPKIDRHHIRADTPCLHQSLACTHAKGTSRSSASTTGITTTHCFSVIACIFILLVEFTSPGNAFSSSCVAEQCAGDFMRALDHDKVLISANLPYCTLLSNYGSCLNRTSRACRGNLKFHSLNTMVMTQIRDHNCAALIEMRRKLGSGTKATVNGKPIRVNLTSEVDEDGVGNGAGGNNGRCLFPYQHQKGSGGYRYCSMFGDPHLRTFEGQYETCRTLGAWPLIDNSYFGVQVTNDPVAEGVDASGISKVTVIVKSLPGCTDQKMFEATRDFLPSTFVDGTANSGDPNTNSISGASYYVATSYDNRGPEGEHRPAVVVRTLELDRHVEIHLRYISTRVVIRRVGSYLTVAIKIPEEVLVQRTSLNTLQLCLTGCPSSERINYKEVLAYPDYYVKKWGAPKPAVSRDQAMDMCREAGVTDFFFDSCVFDLLMTGDESFKDSAVAAMNDIRHLYPPYRKHYETRRSDLLLYDELAKLGRELEFEEREHGHKRRQPGTPYGDRDQQSDDQPSIAQLGGGVSSARARASRTNAATTSPRAMNIVVFCLVLVHALRHCAKW